MTHENRILGMARARADQVKVVADLQRVLCAVRMRGRARELMLLVGASLCRRRRVVFWSLVPPPAQPH